MELMGLKVSLNGNPTGIGLDPAAVPENPALSFLWLPLAFISTYLPPVELLHLLHRAGSLDAVGLASHAGVLPGGGAVDVVHVEYAPVAVDPSLPVCRNGTGYEHPVRVTSLEHASNPQGVKGHHSDAVARQCSS